MEADNDNRFMMKPVEPRRVGCRRSIRLKTAADITRLLGKTINEVLRGEIDSETARTVGYLSSVMVKSIEVGDLAKRVEAIERANNAGMNERGGINES